LPEVVLPNGNWRPRGYQRPLWDYMERGGKRAVCVWHRRAGKDEVLLHRTAIAAVERPANYWHLLPLYTQCRKAIWDAVSAHSGKRRILEAFPEALIDGMNDQEMKIRFKNGSTWQLVGSDRYDTLVGAGVAGVTFSEYALANPSSYGYIRPMITENNGWVAMISTPRGRNHFKTLFDMAQKSPDWFAEQLSALDTGALSESDLEQARDEYRALYGQDMGDMLFDQEYLVSFNAAILGAFYGREMSALRAEGRIDGTLEAVPALPVHRAWDIGVRDDTSIWFFQVVGAQVFVLDCYTANGVGVDHYAETIDKLHAERGWDHGTDYVPHDAKVKEWGTGRTRVETMQGMGLNPSVVPQAGLLDGINAVRRTLPQCVFHSRCEDVGIAALEMYQREWDDNKKMFKQNPLHNWASHLADAFRYLAMAWRQTPVVQPKLPTVTGPVRVGAIMAPAINHRRRAA
jgi:phage terminase large subunit